MPRKQIQTIAILYGEAVNRLKQTWLRFKRGPQCAEQSPVLVGGPEIRRLVLGLCELLVFRVLVLFRNIVRRLLRVKPERHPGEIALWVSVNHDHAVALPGQHPGEIEGRCRLAHPALVIENRDELGHGDLLGSGR